MKDKLYKLYVKDKMTLKQVGENIGCSDAKVLRLLRDYGIPTRPRSSQKFKELNPKQLREWYIDYSWSSIRIAEVVGCSDAAVLKALKKFGIYVRSHKEAAINKNPMSDDHKAKVIANVRKLHKIQVGENHPQWKNARWLDKDGYALIRRNKKTVKEHRWVMEQHIGRKLNEWEEINHKNRIKDDNRIENLEIIPSLHKYKDWLLRHKKTAEEYPF